MTKIGLALSGGGFRATLYHLGLVRFLRDANILPNVTHVTSVSGGSIVAAHLALNWARYSGSASEFEAAATELLSFVQLDVRNRIVRRFPDDRRTTRRDQHVVLGREARERRDVLAVDRPQVTLVELHDRRDVLFGRRALRAARAATR